MTSFTRAEALELWSRLVAGWAEHLDASGARTLMDGVPSRSDAGGSYEGATRMLWGLSGWLSQPGRPARLRWRDREYDTVALVRQVLVSGTDPASPGYWGAGGVEGGYDQRTVESGQVAFGTWLSRERVWSIMTETEREAVIAWLEAFGQRPAEWRNNWALFWGLNHAARKALGVRHDQAIIDDVLAYLDGVYCGDGWYDDGPQRGANHFDDYNAWVFGSHVLAWAQCDGADRPERRNELLARVRRSMVHYPFFFGGDGAYTEYGRSLAYKFARLAAPLWAYQLGVWPHPVGMLRRLVGRHLRWYLDRGAVRGNGTLIQTLTAEGSLEVREPYIGTGSPYWAMLAFGALWSLPDDDPFWSAEEAPLPVERGDFVRVFTQPGWVLVGTRETGAVQRFSACSTHHPAKYDKFVYATAAPFNVGLVDGAPSPDGMLSLTNGQGYHHRCGTLAASVGEPGWLRMRYRQQTGGTHTIDTTIITLGEIHLRAHRVTLGVRTHVSIGAVEGAAPLGYPPGALPVVESEPALGWEGASVDGRCVGILRLRGYDGQHRAAAWQGRHDLNSVYGHYLLPWLTVSRLATEHELVCLVFIGRAGVDPAELAASVLTAEWRADGSFLFAGRGGKQLEIPPLPD
jgi:hypothetical protein